MDISSPLHWFPAFPEPSVSTKETHELGKVLSYSLFSRKTSFDKSSREIG